MLQRYKNLVEVSYESQLKKKHSSICWTNKCLKPVIQKSVANNELLFLIGRFYSIGLLLSHTFHPRDMS
jgi:hypothetical protein